MKNKRKKQATEGKEHTLRKRLKKFCSYTTNEIIVQIAALKEVYDQRSALNH